jgi:hypothetical protein
MCANLDSKNILIKTLKQQLQKGSKSYPTWQIQRAESSDLLAVINSKKTVLKLTLKTVPNLVKDRPVRQPIGSSNFFTPW